MTRKQRRLVALAVGLGLLGAAAALVVAAFNENLVFFYSPSDLATKGVGPDRRIRIGGLVEQQSLRRKTDGHGVGFRVTDGNATIGVVYDGVLPDLFREGQGVVAEGRLGRDGVFAATSVLAKHDENYMPPEVAKKLKEQGVWRGDEQAGAAEGSGKVN